MDNNNNNNNNPNNPNNNNDNNNNPSLPAMAAARAAFLHATNAAGGDAPMNNDLQLQMMLHQQQQQGMLANENNLQALEALQHAQAQAQGNNAQGSPTSSLQPSSSNIMANRSASPTNGAGVGDSPPAPFPTERSTASPPPAMLQKVVTNTTTTTNKGGGSGGIPMKDAIGGVWPLPAYCNFVPGGVEYKPASLVTATTAATASSTSGAEGEEEEEEGMVQLANYCTTGTTTGGGASSAGGSGSGNNNLSSSPKAGTGPRFRGRGLSIDASSGSKGGSSGGGPEVVIRKALAADATLRNYAIHYASNHHQASSGSNGKPTATIVEPGHRLPSLSHLATSALVNPLTAVPAASAVEWAECMILEYMDGRYEQLSSEQTTKTGNTSSFSSFVPCSDVPSTTESNSQQAATVDLLQRAIVSAWATEEAATGRTPTSHTKNYVATTTYPLNEALTMPPPSLSGLLKALYRGQRGEDILPQQQQQQQQNNTAMGGTRIGSGETCTYVGGPCGYVFRRGDIAWNCRTCQTDPTCVLCDACFRESDHEGHEVFFHRTTPGGCCDCGDLEAWCVKGMCGRHCPPEAVMAMEGGGEDEDGEGETTLPGATYAGGEDDFEAVRAAQRTRVEHERSVNGVPSNLPASTANEPQALPPRLAAALGIVIGSTIQSILTAAEGSAVGADVSQWRLKWADEICKVWNGVGEDEEYYRRGAVLMGRLLDKKIAADKEEEYSLWAHPRHVLDSHTEHYTSELPKKYSLHLRLHNDDVHTFEEVIKALHAKSMDPIPVPVGGEGSIGNIGGAGVRGIEIKNLADNAATTTAADGSSDMVEDSAPLASATASGGSSRPSLRSRPDSIDISPRENRRFRSSGASSPTFNRSPVRNRPSAENDTSVQSAHGLDPSAALVPRADSAQDLTRKVDADGQVLVRQYDTLNGAGIGFSRLRSSAGLHCSVTTSARMESEERAKVLLEWLASLIGVHPSVGAMVVQALVDVTDGGDVLCHDDNKTTAVAGISNGVAVWSSLRMMPCWSGTHESWWSSSDGAPAWRRRFEAFPPHLESSYLTREEGRQLFRQGMLSEQTDRFLSVTGADPDFYANVPYSLPSARLHKSPHALWGMLPASHLSNAAANADEAYTHPLLRKLTSSHDDNDSSVHLQTKLFILDTDLRKHEEGEHLTSSLFPHKMAGLNMVSGTSFADEFGSEGSHYFAPTQFSSTNLGITNAKNSMKLASCSSFVAPTSPVLLLLLLDPYSPKNLRSNLHRLFLSLLTDSRFKSRFAASLGAVVYRPTSTLFCAGIGTEADTLLGFTVQLFTTGSLVKALGNLDATKALLCREDSENNDVETGCVSALPIAHSVVRSIHTNILGATREVTVAVKNSVNTPGRGMPPALTYQTGTEHPLSTRLPAAPDDKFIDSRCMKHKRLPHLLRDLEYIYETPGTAGKLLRSSRGSSSTPNPSPNPSPTAMNDSVTPSPSFTAPMINTSNSLSTYNIPHALDYPTVWARLLRLGQGIDLQKRRVSGGHVEFEDERWLGAYGLSLNLSSTGDALSESPFSSINLSAEQATRSTRVNNREAMGNLFAAFFREIKLWLYREGLLETSLARPASRESGELEALQRSTLHIAKSQLDESSVNQIVAATGVAVAQSCDVACEKGVKNLPEAKLALLEAALLCERKKMSQSVQTFGGSSSHGPVMGDWLKVPHSPLAGACFSFHLPLHRALARSILCYCSAAVPAEDRLDSPDNWWRLPILDDDDDFVSDPSSEAVFKQDSMSALVRSTHKSSNFRVVWSSGPECSAPEAQLRKSRSRMLSALLSSTKVVHSLCDHPLRCIAAAQQIDHHMWAKNGGSVAGMALNYGTVPLCRSLRDLDLTMVQLSASGFNVGLGARRVYSLLTNRFSLDGYLCDPDRRNSFGRIGWVKPPRMSETEHPELLAESFFTTLCVIVSDLPAPPPTSLDDNSVLRRNLRRELLHALAVEPRSHSEAMSAASAAVSRRDESEASGAGASSFRAVFTEVLQGIGQQRKQGSRASGPPMFELKSEGSHEYDPSFYHLRKTEHQHAMDNIARLRRQKLGASSKENASTMVLPLVSEPPQAHPRFMASRLLLHLPSMYAAIRRYLMYVLFNGSWLPPAKPEPEDITVTIGGTGEVSVASPGAKRTESFSRTVSSMSNRSSVSASSTSNTPPSFSPETVAASSKSFLEVLHILTLQVHTLGDCSKLHETLPFLDHEQKNLSSNVNINAYLEQLLWVPDSLLNVWALQCTPDGPLPSSGSGSNRGSVLGLLIALYEHRDNAKSTGGNQKSANDDHGGARVLSADGLKWLLRFVGAIVDGAESLTVACESARTGVQVAKSLSTLVGLETCNQAKAMLDNLPDLWPGKEAESLESSNASAASEKSKEVQKAAKARALAKMKKMQSSFAASISSQFNDDSEKKIAEDDEENLCIICKCDDADGNSGPMGYLGHVQRSRVAQLASKSILKEHGVSENLDLDNVYRVVGDKGCQLRSTESMESAPVSFLPRGSLVEVLQSKLSPQSSLKSRRVLVRHIISDSKKDSDAVVQGWASIQSWQGYVILSPLSSICYTNTRWGPTRPIIRQCGHAAHFRCVEAHCLSLHQRAAGNQPYDGRFSANIEDGEFLCPLCKQLSNILIPEDNNSEMNNATPVPQTFSSSTSASMCEDKEGFEIVKNDATSSLADLSLVRNILERKAAVSYTEASSKSDKATHQFGSSLSQAMQLSAENISPQKKIEMEYWHPALRRWDFEDDDLEDGPLSQKSPQIGSVLRLMRQQLISWAALGHSAAASEAAGRGAREVVFGEIMFKSTDPWSGYSSKGKDSHPRLLELRRTLTATASLLDAVSFQMGKQLGSNDEKAKGESVSIVGSLISDILDGQHWMVGTPDLAKDNDWKVITAIVAAMTCHVSKEDVIAQRLEARAVAASMWTITGSAPLASTGSNAPVNMESSPEVEVNNAGIAGNQDNSGLANDPTQGDFDFSAQARPVLPQKPLSISRVERCLGVELNPKWGTLDPFKIKSGSAHKSPFRPAVASVFLYVPLLAWDLNILAGAVFSSLLSSAKTNPCVSYRELLQSAKVLLVGRLIQVVSTPGGFMMSNNDPVDDFDDFDEELFWDDAKKTEESHALKELILHCRKSLHGADGADTQCLDNASLLQSVGNAVLPFARALVLLLRASTSALRLRHRRLGLSGEAHDAAIAEMVEDPTLMSKEDGFQLLDLIGAPLPSDILKKDSSHPSWFSLVTRWLTALSGFEAYHGTQGNGLAYDNSTKTWSSVSCASNNTSSPPLQNIHVETSAAAVEVAHYSPHLENQDGPDAGFEAGSEDLDSSSSNEDEVMEIVDEALAAESESDEELENVDMDVNFDDDDFDFDDGIMGDVGGASSAMAQNELDFDVDDASDVNAALNEPDGSKLSGPNDREFSYVSRSAIIPYQPSILGINQVGPGPRGARGELFEYRVANKVMKDLSHLGSIHVKGEPLRCLVKLPKSFVELYSMVSRVKGRDSRSDDADDDGGFETAICLLTGAVMRSGTIRRMKTNRPAGTCTLHARKVGSGIGIFFLVQKCTILLMHNNKSAYSPSLYVDEHGEEDLGLKRGRPLYFSEERYQALENLWRTHGIPRDVSQIRSTSDRVIRDNWY